MSREIKFRAYIKPLNRYATGLDTIQFHKCCDVTGAGIWTVVTVNEGVFECDDIIIEQYTGLKDKNGKKIYEGDIVEFGLSGRAERGYVGYADEYASFEVYSKRGFIFGCLFGHAGKVIGNIHENGELLGGEK